MNLALLIKISRPRFWLYVLGPYLLGVIIGTDSVFSLSNGTVFAFVLYFLLPANFFLYAINDYFDGDTDQYNLRKKQKEHFMVANERQYIVFTLLLIIVITILLMLLANNMIIGLLLFFFLFLATIYSAPPIRLKATVFFDSLANVLYLIPGVIGYYSTTNTFPSLVYLLAFTSWVMAMHVFSAIPDIHVDKKAKLYTTALFLGRKYALLYCAVLWCIFSLLIVQSFVLFPYTLLLFVYPLLPIVVLGNRIPLETMYEFFPFINSLIGFIFFVLIFVTKINA